jgi:hypothetical protein
LQDILQFDLKKVTLAFDLGKITNT